MKKVALCEQNLKSKISCEILNLSINFIICIYVDLYIFINFATGTINGRYHYGKSNHKFLPV